MGNQCICGKKTKKKHNQYILDRKLTHLTISRNDSGMIYSDQKKDTLEKSKQKQRQLNSEQELEFQIDQTIPNQQAMILAKNKLIIAKLITFVEQKLVENEYSETQDNFEAIYQACKIVVHNILNSREQSGEIKYENLKYQISEFLRHFLPNQQNQMQCSNLDQGNVQNRQNDNFPQIPSQQQQQQNKNNHQQQQNPQDYQIQIKSEDPIMSSSNNQKALSSPKDSFHTCNSQQLSVKQQRSQQKENNNLNKSQFNNNKQKQNIISCIQSNQHSNKRSQSSEQYEDNDMLGQVPLEKEYDASNKSSQIKSSDQVKEQKELSQQQLENYSNIIEKIDQQTPQMTKEMSKQFYSFINTNDPQFLSLSFVKNQSQQFNVNNNDDNTSENEENENNENQENINPLEDSKLREITKRLSQNRDDIENNENISNNNSDSDDNKDFDKQLTIFVDNIYGWSVIILKGNEMQKNKQNQQLNQFERLQKKKTYIRKFDDEQYVSKNDQQKNNFKQIHQNLQKQEEFQLALQNLMNKIKIEVKTESELTQRYQLLQNCIEYMEKSFGQNQLQIIYFLEETNLDLEKSMQKMKQYMIQKNALKIQILTGSINMGDSVQVK